MSWGHFLMREEKAALIKSNRVHSRVSNKEILILKTRVRLSKWNAWNLARWIISWLWTCGNLAASQDKSWKEILESWLDKNLYLLGLISVHSCNDFLNVYLLIRRSALSLWHYSDWIEITIVSSYSMTEVYSFLIGICWSQPTPAVSHTVLHLKALLHWRVWLWCYKWLSCRRPTTFYTTCLGTWKHNGLL